MKRINLVLNRIKTIYKTEGMLSLLKMVSQYLISHIYYYQQLYLYKRILKYEDGARKLPKVLNYTVKIVTSNQQVDELVADGFEDFRLHMLYAAKYLEKGAIALCIFVNKEFANINWATTRKEAKNLFVPAPFKVDFSKNEATMEGIYTTPKYRHLGLNSYGTHKMRQFLLQRGITAERHVIVANNTAQQETAARYAGGPYAKARYMKILWWHFWKETSIALNT